MTQRQARGDERSKPRLVRRARLMTEAAEGGGAKGQDSEVKMRSSGGVNPPASDSIPGSKVRIWISMTSARVGTLTKQIRIFTQYDSSEKNSYH